MMRTRLVFLLALFALLTIFSLLGVYFSQQTPTEQPQVTTLLTYYHDGQYDYIAQLASNNLYNKTTLKPGEGMLYTKITKLINVTFTYTFNCTLPANTTIQYITDESMQSSNWAKTIVASPSNTLDFSKTNVAQFSTKQSVNLTALDELKNSIDKETGTYTQEYSLIIQPQIRVIANTSVGIVNEPFAPNMTMSFKHGTPSGDYIAIEGLTHTQQGNIQHTETIYHPEVVNERYVSYGFSIVFISAVIGTTRAYMKAKPEKRAKTIEEIVAPYEETIFELAEEPSQKTTEVTTVKMQRLEDLISIADGLAKPVLYLKKTPSRLGEKTKHVFYVLDGSVRYEYEICQ